MIAALQHAHVSKILEQEKHTRKTYHNLATFKLFCSYQWFTIMDVFSECPRVERHTAEIWLATPGAIIWLALRQIYGSPKRTWLIYLIRLNQPTFPYYSGIISGFTLFFFKYVALGPQNIRFPWKKRKIWGGCMTSKSSGGRGANKNVFAQIKSKSLAYVLRKDE